MIVWSRVRLTSLPPAAAMSKSVSHISVAAHLHRNIVLGNFSHGGVHCRPFAARAASNAVANLCEQLFPPAAQGLRDNRVRLFSPQFGAQRFWRASTRSIFSLLGR